MEFKNDKGFWSSQFYLVFFARRLAYVVSQVYFHSSVYLQGGLNIFFTLATLAFLLYFRPFKETSILVSNIIGETIILVSMVLSYCLIWNWGQGFEDDIEASVIFTVLGGLVLQMGVSIYQFGKCMKVLWYKYEKQKSLEFLKQVEVSTNMHNVWQSVDK